MHAGVAAQFQQQGHGVLGHIAYAIGNHIANGNTPGGQCISIHYVVARGQHANHAHTAVQLLQVGADKGRFVDKHNINAACALCHSFGGSGIVDGYLTD